MPTNKTKKIEYPKTPTLDKMLKLKEESQAIGNFIDWLESEKKILFYHRVPESIEYFDKEFEKQVKQIGENTPEARLLRCNNTDKWDNTGGLIPFYMPIEKILGEYFNIDLKKAEEERLAILEYTRNVTNKNNK